MIGPSRVPVKAMLEHNNARASVPVMLHGAIPRSPAEVTFASVTLTLDTSTDILSPSGTGKVLPLAEGGNIPDGDWPMASSSYTKLSAVTTGAIGGSGAPNSSRGSGARSKTSTPALSKTSSSMVFETGASNAPPVSAPNAVGPTVPRVFTTKLGDWVS